MQAMRLFLGRRDGTVSFADVRTGIGAYVEAFERLLGISGLAWPIADEATLRFWFG